jgi:hypothetical protein
MLKQLLIDIVVVLGIPIAIVFAYYYIMGPEAGFLIVPDTFTSATPGADATGGHVEDVLTQLNSISFDKSIFDDEAFLSFEDYTKPISTTTIGREFPFTLPDELRAVMHKVSEVAPPSTLVSTPSLRGAVR